MVTPLTALYSCLLAALFLVLSVRVIARRRAGRVSLGVGGDPDLERAVRVHANFAEYVPFALFLLLLAELNHNPAWLLHLVGIALLVGRVSHAVALSRRPQDLRLRVVGVGCTLTVLGVLAFLLLLSAVRGLAA